LSICAREGGEPPPEEHTHAQFDTTEPVQVLLTLVPDGAAAAGDVSRNTVVLLNRAPRVREVGQLEEKHCTHVNVVTLGVCVCWSYSVCVCGCMCLRACVCIYTWYTYTYISYTYIRTYIHTCI
jgi:hypothetical protein